MQVIDKSAKAVPSSDLPAAHRGERRTSEAGPATDKTLSWLPKARRLKLKNDRFRKIRGGSAVLLLLSCSRCAAKLMLYQKDGDGSLRRCYLNRIFAPPDLEALQHDPSIADPKQLAAL